MTYIWIDNTNCQGGYKKAGVLPDLGGDMSDPETLEDGLFASSKDKHALFKILSNIAPRCLVKYIATINVDFCQLMHICVYKIWDLRTWKKEADYSQRL